MTDTDRSRGLEKEAIGKLTQLLDTFRVFERPLYLIARGKYTPEEILEAEGKKCIIQVSGLRYHDLSLYFQVSSLSLRQVQPFEDADTFVQVPIGIINTFLSRILSGDDSAFGDMVAGNEVKFRGKHTFHDLRIFSDVTSTLAKNIARIRQVSS